MPTHRALSEAHQDPVRFKNLLRQLPEYEFLEPARALLHDDLFWMPKSAGLALFAAPDFFAVYRESISFPEIAVDADQFVIRPLLPLLMADGRYLILVLSQRRMRLFSATRHECVELDVPSAHRRRLQRQVHFHTDLKTVPGKGRRAAMFFGHGAGQEDSKPYAADQFAHFDQWIESRFRRLGLPLVLAGVDYLHPLYRSVSTYPNLVDEGLIGNFERTPPATLNKQARPLIERHFRGRRESMLAKSRRNTNQAPEIYKAAEEGRIEALFAPPDMTDGPVIQTLLHDGSVFPAETLSAILRY
jgi:hypothetical protein